jgi:hypothetical protein
MYTECRTDELDKGDGMRGTVYMYLLYLCPFICIYIFKDILTYSVHASYAKP